MRVKKKSKARKKNQFKVINCFAIVNSNREENYNLP